MDFQKIQGGQPFFYQIKNQHLRLIEGMFFLNQTLLSDVPSTLLLPITYEDMVLSLLVNNINIFSHACQTPFLRPQSCRISPKNFY